MRHLSLCRAFAQCSDAGGLNEPAPGPPLRAAAAVTVRQGQPRSVPRSSRRYSGGASVKPDTRPPVAHCVGIWRRAGSLRHRPGRCSTSTIASFGPGATLAIRRAHGRAAWPCPAADPDRQASPSATAPPGAAASCAIACHPPDQQLPHLQAGELAQPLRAAEPICPLRINANQRQQRPGQRRPGAASIKYEAARPSRWRRPAAAPWCPSVLAA